MADEKPPSRNLFRQTISGDRLSLLGLMASLASLTFSWWLGSILTFFSLMWIWWTYRDWKKIDENNESFRQFIIEVIYDDYKYELIPSELDKKKLSEKQIENIKISQENTIERVSREDNKEKQLERKQLSTIELAIDKVGKDMQAIFYPNSVKQLHFVKGFDFTNWLRLTKNQFYISEKRTKLTPLIATFENQGAAIENVQAQISYFFGDAPDAIEVIPNRVENAYWFADTIRPKVSFPFHKSNRLIVAYLKLSVKISQNFFLVFMKITTAELLEKAVLKDKLFLFE